MGESQATRIAHTPILTLFSDKSCNLKGLRALYQRNATGMQLRTMIRSSKHARFNLFLGLIRECAGS